MSLHRIRIRVAEVSYVDVEIEADSREEALEEVRGNEWEYVSSPGWARKDAVDFEYEVEEGEPSAEDGR